MRLACAVAMGLFLAIFRSLPAEATPTILEGESLRVIAPHHTDGGGHPTGVDQTHYFAESGDSHHFAWGGVEPSSPGVLTIKYDFRSQGGFPNLITPEQEFNATGAMISWSSATGGKVRFVRDTTAPASEIINIGTGDLAALGEVSGPLGILGLGGGDFTHGVSHTVTSGVAWMDFAENWDTTIGNGDPPGTFDYSTIAAQEIGHALGLGHLDNVPGPDLMDGFYSVEQTVTSLSDIEHIQSIYGGQGPTGGGTNVVTVRCGFDSWLIPDGTPLDLNPSQNQITVDYQCTNQPGYTASGIVLAATDPGNSASITLTDLEVSNTGAGPVFPPDGSLSVGQFIPVLGPATLNTLCLGGYYDDILGGSLSLADVRLSGLAANPPQPIPPPFAVIDPAPVFGLPGGVPVPFSQCSGLTLAGPVSLQLLFLEFDLGDLGDAVVLPSSAEMQSAMVPEPSTALLVASGLAGIAMRRAKRARGMKA